MADADAARPLVQALHALPPWRGAADFGQDDWAAYTRLARRVQAADPGTVAAALDAFSRDAGAADEPYAGFEDESKPFLLMRVVFDLPTAAPAAQRFAYKGWSNWPAPDASGQVDLGWPVAWEHGHPRLAASYEGSMGQPYAAAREYRFLLDTFPFRALG